MTCLSRRLARLRLFKIDFLGSSYFTRERIDGVAHEARVGPSLIGEVVIAPVVVTLGDCRE